MIRFVELRVLGLLRRIARSLESIAASQSTLSMYAAKDWDERHQPPVPQGLRKAVHFDTFDVEAANERYRKQRAADGIEENDIP